MDVRTVFMGSPEFALPSLTALAAHFHVVGVVTQPDRPAGRGRTLTAPPVKKLAQELDLPVIQPVRLRSAEAFEQLAGWQPELIVVAAYGQILRQVVLDLPSFGCINVHASLLPRWRGASPIQAAILAGDTKSGITIMKMDAGIDTGDILAQQSLDILETDTAQTLESRLAALGGALLMETLPGYIQGRIQPLPQPEDGATYAPMRKKEEGELDWSEPAKVLERKVRAFQPWPGTFLNWEGGDLKVQAARVRPFDEPVAPGLRSEREKFPVVAARDGWLVLEEVQPAGKKNMPGNVFLNGAPSWRQV